MSKEELLIYAQDQAIELVKQGGDLGEFYIYLAQAVYNKAIDDAKLELEKDQFSVYDEVMLNELKIRD